MKKIDQNDSVAVKKRLLKLMAKHVVWPAGAKVCTQSTADSEIYFSDTSAEDSGSVCHTHMGLCFYRTGVPRVSACVYVLITKQEFDAAVEKRLAKGKKVAQKG